jgi:hypothetical protein
VKRLACVALAACSGSAAPAHPIEQHVAPTPPKTWRFRQVELGSARRSARRTTFELVLDADRARLVENHAHAQGSFTLDTIAQAAWAADGQVIYTGTWREKEPGYYELDLTAPDVQPLHLFCRKPYIRLLARADAHRLPLDCAGKLFGDEGGAFAYAILCGGEIPEPNDDDADQLCFSEAPGVERVDVNDGCELGQVGLRLAAP